MKEPSEELIEKYQDLKKSHAESMDELVNLAEERKHQESFFLASKKNPPKDDNRDAEKIAWREKGVENG